MRDMEAAAALRQAVNDVCGLVFISESEIAERLESVDLVSSLFVALHGCDAEVLCGRRRASEPLSACGIQRPIQPPSTTIVWPFI
jgi:hypothetical protein